MALNEPKPGARKPKGYWTAGKISTEVRRLYDAGESVAAGSTPHLNALKVTARSLGSGWRQILASGGLDAAKVRARNSAIAYLDKQIGPERRRKMFSQNLDLVDVASKVRLLKAQGAKPYALSDADLLNAKLKTKPHGYWDVGNITAEVRREYESGRQVTSPRHSPVLHNLENAAKKQGVPWKHVIAGAGLDYAELLARDKVIISKGKPSGESSAIGGRAWRYKKKALAESVLTGRLGEDNVRRLQERGADLVKVASNFRQMVKEGLDPKRVKDPGLFAHPPERFSELLSEWKKSGKMKPSYDRMASEVRQLSTRAGPGEVEPLYRFISCVGIEDAQRIYQAAGRPLGHVVTGVMDVMLKAGIDPKKVPAPYFAMGPGKELAGHIPFLKERQGLKLTDAERELIEAASKSDAMRGRGAKYGHEYHMPRV